MAKRPITKKAKAVENQKRIVALRSYWSLGKEIAGRLEGEKKSARGGIFVAFGKKKKCSRVVLDQAHKFFRLYPTAKSLERLFRQFRKGHALTRKHVNYLNAVHDPSKRQRLLDASITQGWSSEQLRHQITKRLRYKRYESIERRKPHSLEDARLQLADVAYQWVLWSKRLEAAGLTKKLEHELGKGMPKDLATVLRICHSVCDFEETRIESRKSKKQLRPNG